jgi:uncharacterized protein (UPF0335 family)
MPDIETNEESSEAQSFAKSQLRALVERIERLEEDKKALADDIREVYGEAKANGFDTKALRAVVRLRSQEPSERQEFEAIVELYRDALGLGADVPLLREPADDKLLEKLRRIRGEEELERAA